MLSMRSNRRVDFENLYVALQNPPWHGSIFQNGHLTKTLKIALISPICDLGHLLTIRTTTKSRPRKEQNHDDVQDEERVLAE